MLAMDGLDSDYQVVYCDEKLLRFVSGGWVFFQRLRIHGGGYWLGRIYDNVFMIEYERPTTLSEGLVFLRLMKQVEADSNVFDHDFSIY
jgi:hypothetical protein